MFQQVSRYLKTVAITSKITALEMKGLSDESVKPSSMSDNTLNAGINYFDNSRIWVKFKGNCLKQKKLTFTHKQVVNTYIVCELNLWPFTVGQNLD